MEHGVNQELVVSLLFFATCTLIYVSDFTPEVTLRNLQAFPTDSEASETVDRRLAQPAIATSQLNLLTLTRALPDPTRNVAAPPGTQSVSQSMLLQPLPPAVNARNSGVKVANKVAILTPDNGGQKRPSVLGAAPRLRGGNTNKGVNAVFGLNTNDDLLRRPEFDRVMEKCMVDFRAAVQEQLSPWPDRNITQRRLDRLFCVRKQVAKISYVAGQLRHASFQLNMDLNRLMGTMWLIHLAAVRAEASGRRLPDFEIVLNPTDKTSAFAKGRSKEWEDPLPLFCNAKCAGDTSISFPIMFNGQFGGAAGEMSVPLYESKYAELLAMGTPTPWADKKPFLFFSSTNVRGNRAAIFRSRSPAVTALPEVVPIAKYGEYKYLIYAYGHSGWSQRLRELAFMDAVMLLEESPCHEYYHHAFRPGQHYLSAREDLTDLEERPSQAMSDNKQAATMAGAWVATGRRVMALPCVLQYVEDVLREYSLRQDFAPQPRPGWPLHRLNVTQAHFLQQQPPSVQECRPYL